MSDVEQPDRDPTPAERRLDQHLQLLRAAELEPDRSLAARIVRTVRWQRAIRAPLRVAGMIAGAALDGLLALLAPSKRHG